MKTEFPPSSPRLYSDLASWFHLLTAPEDYAEEAEIYRKALLAASQHPPQTLLELGSGGGNNASHLKNHFALTLVDLSHGMLAISQALNPECEHLQGDMRTIRLGRLFDCVFIHDAIMYLTSEVDLRATFETAFTHCRPGGAALFAPDHVRETFQPATDHGGHDGERRSMRYLEWAWDPDPDDTTYLVDFAYLLKDENDDIHCEYDRHILGLFSRQTWLGLLAETGFQPRSIPFTHSQVGPGSCEIFLGIKPL